MVVEGGDQVTIRVVEDKGAADTNGEAVGTAHNGTELGPQ